MERGRFFGFFLDGPDAGRVQEASSRFYTVLRPSPVSAVAYTYGSDAGRLLSAFEPIREEWHHQEVVIGDRTYGVWMRTAFPSVDEYNAAIPTAILALIDMDPVQARLCETRPRRV